MLFFVVAALVVFSIWKIDPFLAVNDPVDNGALIVEGWLPDYAMQQVITEFRNGRRSQIYVTGGRLKNGASLSEYNNFAELGAATLVRLGLNTNAIQVVPAAKVRLDRTYASAVALKNWLISHGSIETNFTIVSLGPHTRRTRLLFERAFGKNYTIGTIALEDEEYDAKRWWTSSAGVRTMIDETIAYIYARLTF